MTTMFYVLWAMWLAPLIPCFFGLGMGPSFEQKRDAGLLYDVGQYGVNKGEQATGQAQDFWSSILSGDMSKIMKVLSPQISAIKGQGQQAKETAAQFGNRSGGTNAAMQMTDDRTRQEINNLISSLTGSAASNLGQMGLSELGLGLEGGKEAFTADSAIQELNQKKWGDIFNSISAVIGGISGMPGMKGTKGGDVLKGVAGMF